jgi:hypothetical protein
MHALLLISKITNMTDEDARNGGGAAIGFLAGRPFMHTT